MQAVDIPMDDGAVLHAVTYPASGPAVVFLHDLGCSHEYWTQVIDRLRALDDSIACISVDMRGHGHSTVADPPSRRRLVKDLKRLCKALDLSNPVVCGHGWGADVALSFDGAGSVVAVNPLLGRPPAPFDDVEAPPMVGVRDAETREACLIGILGGKAIRRGPREAPLLLISSAPADAMVLEGTDVAEHAMESYAVQDGTRHLPVEMPAGVAALLLSWITEAT